MSIKSSRTWALAGIAVLTLGGTVWGLLRFADDDETNLPAELTVENLKAQVKEDPGKAMETIRQASRREDLTDEQRRKLFGNMREVWQAQMAERVDEYFAAADDEKEALLDRHIDEFQERMKEWSQQREKREQERKEAETKADSNDADKDEKESGAERMHRRFGSRTQQERKEHSESRDPDSSARMMAYFTAMRARATARGISMWGGRGGSGGSGGHGGGWHR
ncbi:MAG: hypothetical protein IID37_13000 [Planctomycetes bacterium]|nr:hypothetical protein [Planctomycetota bacterium]